LENSAGAISIDGNAIKKKKKKAREKEKELQTRIAVTKFPLVPNLD
jgi:hypothetical protein